MNHFLKNHGATIIWAICIFIFSSIPTLKSPDLGIALQDKWTHMIEFSIFGFFLQRSFTNCYGNCFKSYLFAFVVGTAYGGLDEIHQAFVPGRESDIIDFYADSIGIFTALVIYYAVKRKK